MVQLTLRLLTLLLALAMLVVVGVVAWGGGLLVLLVDAVVAPWVALRRRAPTYRPRSTAAASIIVVSWNGQHFLRTLLPSLRRAVDEHGGDHEVIIVDNGSTDGSVEWLRREHPWVKVVALAENRFFVRGNLAGVEVATKDVVVFLNNDMEVRPGFLAPLLEGLRDPRVFGVTAEVFFRDPAKRREETGRTRGEIRNGWLKLAHVLPTRDERELAYVPTFWAGGGSSAFDRRLFLEFGGFDDLYDPFYMEDAGLSYQAWKRGYDLLFTARASVLHEHRGTSRRVFGDDFVDNMIRRNQHLFLWRGVTDPRCVLSIFGLLPISCLVRARRPGSSWVRGIWFELRALGKALPRLPRALGKRCVARPFYVRTDREVGELSASIRRYRAAGRAGLGALSLPAQDGLRLLVMSARLPRLDTDGSWVLHQRLVELARNHRVTLFAFVDEPGGDAGAAELSNHGIEVVTCVRERNRRAGNLHHRVPWRLFRDYSAAPMVRAARRMLEGTDYDLVQVEYVEMAHLLRGILRGEPAVYTCHESLSLATARAPSATRGFAARARASFAAAQSLAYESELLADYRAVVALSAVDAAHLRVRDGTPVRVIPTGIDLGRWSSPPAVVAAPATIAFVGYFRHEPNVVAAQWLVREVLPRLHRSVPAARIELIGREPSPAVERLASAAVAVRGFVPDLAAALAAATVVAVPILTGGGLRGKILEAWAARKAVVATPIACEGLAAEPGVHCMVATGPDEFATALARCIADEALRAALGAAGHRLVAERYTAAATAARFVELYREVARCR
jgi:GT2 family glycosyltransferase/glycosyltransferase involved in cell wall biosynthesis